VFGEELAWLDRDGGEAAPSIPTRIPEFDVLIGDLRAMKARISDLMAEVAQKEKRRSDLEIQSLLFQINPHFLMNSLYTIHWLAVDKGQDEIESLEEYILLQRSRYDFDFSLTIEIGPESLGIRMPRFVLQPLVENALLHGPSDSCRIELRVDRSDGLIEIAVLDNGPGIPEGKLRELLADDGFSALPEGSVHKAGMGIGIRYVKRALETYYGCQACLAISSLEAEEETEPK
jgi:two-component system sensor histidine kinase YesM